MRIDWAGFTLFLFLAAFAIGAGLAPKRPCPGQDAKAKEAEAREFLLRAEVADLRARLRLVAERDERARKAVASGLYLPLPLPDPMPDGKALGLR